MKIKKHRVLLISSIVILFSMFMQLFVSADSPKNQTVIDTPSQTVASSISVSGWAYNMSGISRIDIYAWDSENKAHGLGSIQSAQLYYRADVIRANPGFGKTNTGYSVSCNVSSLQTGSYILAVAAIGKNGTVQWASKSFKIDHAPLIDIDSPSNNTRAMSFTISGWALNKVSVGRVDSYLFDNNGKAHFVGTVSASNFYERKDVQKAFPQYGTDKCGYTLKIGSNKFADGTYTLAVANVGTDGSVVWATKKITIGYPAMTDIDSPQNNTSFSSSSKNNLKISGWALNDSGINRIDVYAYDSSGKPHGLGSIPSSELYSRSDVYKAYPQYNLLNCGYSKIFDASKLSSGKYTLAVAGIGKNGTVQWATKQINLGLRPEQNIDSVNLSSSAKTISVSGWALNDSGINRIDVYAYDSSGKAHGLGSIPSGELYSRSDVYKTYPQYGNVNCGYIKTFSLNGFSYGTYTLAVAAIGNDGSVQWNTKSFSYKIYSNALEEASYLAQSIGVSSDGTTVYYKINGNDAFLLYCKDNGEHNLYIFNYTNMEKVKEVFNFYFGNDANSVYNDVISIHNMPTTNGVSGYSEYDYYLSNGNKVKINPYASSGYIWMSWTQ